ncbi:uncharacterized protein V6R79_015622 [Siganus canaliculatus]
MTSFLLLVFLLWCPVYDGAQMTLTPERLTVLRGEDAFFTCSPNKAPWTVMVWSLNNAVILTISKDTGVLPSIIPNVTAKEQGSNWVLNLTNTQREHQGEVTCDLQGNNRGTSNLFVQEKGSVKVLGNDKLAFQGRSVLFECQAAGWFPRPTLKWKVGDTEVSPDHYNTSSVESEGNLFTVSSNLSVTAVKSSVVYCFASVSPPTSLLNSSVRLTVVAEVVHEVNDCTVPLAVTASLTAFLLLLLLCIGAVLWYIRRRQAKSSPQEAIRSDQSVSWRDVVAQATGGKVNQGYSGEGPTGERARCSLQHVGYRN